MQTKLQARLLIATTNPGKVRELRQLLQDLPGLELVTLADLGIDFDVPETGSTYQQNAALKARAYAQASGLLTLADDSGLEVDALDGAPGLRSKRYSPKPGATDADRRATLLQNLAGKPRPWAARFRAWVALAQPDGEMCFAEGVCVGEIIPQERGENGFGYDPIFFIPEAGLTMAELTSEAKNRISHRARAVQAALPLLREMLGLENK